jgi:hypothetical protein
MYHIRSYKEEDFDFNYSTVNDFKFYFKYTAKTKDRVIDIIDKVVKNNCVASRYITDIDLSKDKHVVIVLRINDLYCEPTGHHDILETEEKKKWVYEELEYIFKAYLVSFHDKMKKDNQINDNTLVLIDDKVFKYNQKFFEKIYISIRDKRNIKIISKMQLVNYSKDKIHTTLFKLGEYGMETKTNSISTKLVKMDFVTEKNISYLKKRFEK